MDYYSAKLELQNMSPLTRKTWNSKKWVFKNPLPEKTIIDIFKNIDLPFDLAPLAQLLDKDFGSLCMITEAGFLFNGWLPSESDIIATDWVK